LQPPEGGDKFPVSICDSNLFWSVRPLSRSVLGATEAFFRWWKIRSLALENPMASLLIGLTLSIVAITVVGGAVTLLVLHHFTRQIRMD
jgi:hypothetical protein